MVAFFFFKQKTAYEMRISDWSSDVCSSDLDGLVDALGGGFAVAALEETWNRAIAQKAVRFVLIGNLSELLSHPEARDHASGNVRRQIGRASCRERVCQYV